MSQQSALLGIKSEYLEISELNFTWPGENGTFQGFESINYTMPSDRTRRCNKGRSTFAGLLRDHCILHSRLSFYLCLFAYIGMPDGDIFPILMRNLGPWYWPWCPLWRYPQHPLFQLSNILFVASYCAPSTKKGQLWMHTILIFGFMLYSIWAWHVICSPDAFSWNFGFVFLNLAQVVYLVYEMRPVKFDPELEEVYHTLFEPFKVTRLQFKRMVSPDFAHIMSLHAGEAYAMQNLTKTDRLGLLLSGKVNVMSGHQFLHPILPCEFLDSPEFESSRATIDEKFKVSIVAASSCRYVYWQRTSLEYLFVKEPYLACVVTTLIARDITTKLYAMNNKIVTERGSHLDIRLPSISHALARSPRRLRSANKLPPPTTVQPVPPEKRPNCWARDTQLTVNTAKRNGIAGAAYVEEDEELIPLAEHEAPAASSDDLSVADSCPDTSSKYHSCEAVETDDELRH